jgi:hypothetical protein
MPAPSGRHSTGKARRNSAGSDISSAHSSDGNSLKDRVASLATSGDAPEDNVVPPVPPLPKDLSTYKPPPLSTATPHFPPSTLLKTKTAAMAATQSAQFLWRFYPSYLRTPPRS